MTEKPLKKQPRRSAGRPFRPGESGNPAGKPKGVRSKSTVFGEQIMQADAEEIIKSVVSAAKGGDATAMRLCVERLIPVRKGRPLEFPLSRIKGAADVASALGEVSALMAEGTLSPDEASAIAGVLETHRRAIETCELETRVAALEKQTQGTS